MVLRTALTKNAHLISLMVTGLTLIFTGVILFSIHVDILITLLVGTSGVTLLISGLKYKEPGNTPVSPGGWQRSNSLNGDERPAYPLTGEARKAYVRSAYFLTSMVGVVILLIGLAGGLLIRELGLWFLLVAFFGLLLLFAGRLVKAADKK
jgi:hypothetical protein